MSDAKEDEIARLQNQINSLTNQLEAANQANKGKAKRRQIAPSAVHIQQVEGGFGQRPFLQSRREMMGRSASICTRQVMNNLPTGENDYSNHPLALRIMDMFQRPSENMDYLNSEQFAKDLFKLCQKVRHVLEGEPRCVYLQSPAYIFGDIHGNLEDLHFFSDNIWRLGMSLTAGNFLFLGDYVDRGMNCLEVTAYLLAMKLQLPNKVFLLRGNHETRDVNGWEEHYGERSFIYQCRNRFGDDIGYRIWEACNQVFDRLPLCGVVDQDIFCVHGGIPRPVGDGTTRIQDILNVSKVAGINPPYEHEDDDYQQVASDCIWSDPASEEQEQYSVDPETGFGESLRGGGAICFGNKAITDFLAQQNFSYIMRAHEAHAEGVAVSKGARVFTVFSTSKDHNQGSQALAGCILVDGEKLQVVNRSPAYKNQYVHRRDSVSLDALSPHEISKRIKLGLIADDDDSSEEEWDDFDSEEEYSDEEEDTQIYTFSKERRRSSVNLNDMAQRFNSDEWDSTHTSGYVGASSRNLSNLEDTIEEEDEDESTVEGDIN